MSEDKTKKPGDDSACAGVPDEECDKRKDCKMPDGTRCPAYPKRQFGRLV